MKQVVLFVLLNMFMAAAWCQTTDSIPASSRGKVTVTKDDRIDMLGKKMAEYNEGLAFKTRLEQGYRLMMLNTTDRTLAIQIRSRLMQQYPDQNVYMSFQSPYIKLKFGDFLDKEDAEKMRKELTNLKIVTGNIYVVPEMVEVKPDKTKQAPTTDE